VHTDVRSRDDDTRLRAAKRLRRFAAVWPALDDEERSLLEAELRRLQEKASA
jgi:hypothetical protein